MEMFIAFLVPVAPLGRIGLAGDDGVGAALEAATGAMLLLLLLLVAVVLPAPVVALEGDGGAVVG